MPIQRLGDPAVLVVIPAILENGLAMQRTSDQPMRIDACKGSERSAYQIGDFARLQCKLRRRHDLAGLVDLRMAILSIDPMRSLRHRIPKRIPPRLGQKMDFQNRSPRASDQTDRPWQLGPRPIDHAIGLPEHRIGTPCIEDNPRILGRNHRLGKPRIVCNRIGPGDNGLNLSWGILQHPEILGLDPLDLLA